MKSIFSKLAARYQGKKFLATVITIGTGVYLIKTGHVMEGVTAITGATGTFNIGQGMADAKQASTPPIVATPVAGQN